jgi:hypothetical protein
MAKATYTADSAFPPPFRLSPEICTAATEAMHPSASQTQLAAPSVAAFGPLTV